MLCETIKLLKNSVPKSCESSLNPSSPNGGMDMPASSPTEVFSSAAVPAQPSVAQTMMDPYPYPTDVKHKQEEETALRNPTTTRPPSASSFSNLSIIPPILGTANEGKPSEEEVEEAKPKKTKKALKFNLKEKKVEEVVAGVHECLSRLHELDDESYASDGASNDLVYLKEASVCFTRGPQRAEVCQAYLEGNTPELFQRIWKTCFPLVFVEIENKHAYNNMKDIMIVLWNGTDLSKALCDRMAESGALEEIQGYLKDGKLSPTELKNSYKNYLVRGLMGITNNCAQQTDCIHLLRQNEGVDMYLSYYNSTNMMVSLKSIMILAFIITEEENEKIMANDLSFKFMADILKNCMESPDLHSKKYGYSAHEIVEVFNRLAANDGNKKRIVESGVLPHYVKLMAADMDTREQKLAARGIWALSFKCSEDIRKELGCLEALQNLSKNSPDPEVRRQAMGALWILKAGKPQRAETQMVEEQTRALSKKKSRKTPSEVPPAPPPPQEGPLPPPPPLPSVSESIQTVNASLSLTKGSGENVIDDQPHVFISYNWASKPIMLKVKERLKTSGYKVWMDVEDMTGSILEAMALAVEKAAVVLICFSQKYKESPNCRTEAEYTFKMGKSIIPLRLQYRYVPDGWLGALLGNKLFFDFSRDERFEDSVSGLIRELGPRGHTLSESPEIPLQAKPEIVTATKYLDLTVAPVKKPNIADWKCDEIQKWLEKVGFGHKKERFKEFDGVSILEYRIMQQAAPQFFFESLKQDMGFSLNECLKFSHALKSLGTE